MKEKLEQIKAEAVAQIQAADQPEKLNDVRVKFLGRKGELTAVLKGMKDVAPEERPKVGQMVNDTRAAIEQLLDETKAKMEKAIREQKLKEEVIDVTLPSKKNIIGHRHPNTIAQEEVERIFVGMGYEVIEGPEIEYDEYNFDLDDIEHDPYVLISILSALHEAEFTLDEVQGTLQMLFDKQYILTTEEIVETRYRTETRVGSYTTTDPETGATSTEYYTYEVEVPYEYRIMNVTLENFNLSHVPVYIMSQDQLSMYAIYMSVVGNREDLFPNSEYVDKYITNPPDDYTVNSAYLSDETFATLIEEAEKYLNYPYVWGGSNPDTSFDCSGFVSYVLTNSGLVNTGRLGAQGLYNVCTPVSRADAQPGDLIFFVGTYDTPGVSHVGIYVGDGVMLHCGDPIQYTSINTSYWQSHFYAFGRPNY